MEYIPVHVTRHSMHLVTNPRGKITKAMLVSAVNSGDILAVDWISRSMFHDDGRQGTARDFLAKFGNVQLNVRDAQTQDLLGVVTFQYGKGPAAIEADGQTPIVARVL